MRIAKKKNLVTITNSEGIYYTVDDNTLEIVGSNNKYRGKIKVSEDAYMKWFRADKDNACELRGTHIAENRPDLKNCKVIFLMVKKILRDKNGSTFIGRNSPTANGELFKTITTKKPLKSIKRLNFDYFMSKYDYTKFGGSYINTLIGYLDSYDVSIHKDAIKYMQSNDYEDLYFSNYCKMLCSLSFIFTYTDKSVHKDITDFFIRDSWNMYDDAETIAYVSKLISIYGYNPKHIIAYMKRLPLTNGLTKRLAPARLLYDYARMQSKINANFDKFPRWLVPAHDLASVKYKFFIEKESHTNKIELQYEQKLKKYEYFKDDIFSVIAPKSTDDMINEGEELNHCVASYIGDVAQGKTKVLFIRKNNFISKPLCTIEIKGAKVVHSACMNNSEPNSQIREFIKKYEKFLLGVVKDVHN